MRIIVCGGRRYADPIKIWRTLDELDRETEERIRCVIDGASDDVTGPYIGADYWGHQWALARNKPTIRCHAEWKTQCGAAGPIRNGRMLKEHGPIDAVVAFPGGNGTRDMMRKAHAAGVRVIEVK